MNRKQAFTLVTLLLGVFMGALDTGIISPALTTIIKSLNVDAKWAVWTITVYSLAYTMSMPLLGKLSDRYGRKRLFIIGIGLFGIGSFLSATSHTLVQLLLARVLQAIGGGGIFPVATAEVADAFPVEKRGMALGITGATFGVANILAPNIGGFILDHWSWNGIFYVNLPIVVVTLLLALRLQESPRRDKKPMDIWGTASLSALILCFMYGLTNLKSDDFLGSLLNINVWGFLLAALVFLALFILAERRAADPVIRLELFKNREITLGLIISSFTGFGITAMFFLPAFAQNVVGLSSGQSGYVVTPLALASGFLAPASGILTDKIGAKRVILMGFFLMGIGSLLFAEWVSSLSTLIVSEIIIGAGIAFTMGTPLNYLILSCVEEQESGSAMGILSVFRSTGTTLGPTILVGFLGTSALGSKLGTAMKESVSTYMSTHPAFASEAAPFMSHMNDMGQFASLSDFSKIQPYLPADLYNELYTKAQAVVQQVMTEGFRHMYVAAAAAMAMGFVITLGLKSVKEQIRRRQAAADEA